MGRRKETRGGRKDTWGRRKKKRGGRKDTRGVIKEKSGRRKAKTKPPSSPSNILDRRDRCMAILL